MLTHRRTQDSPGGGGIEKESPEPSAVKPAADEAGRLVGTVEISIAASTRTRFLTLNAPEVIKPCRLGLLTGCYVTHQDTAALLQVPRQRQPLV